MGTLALRDLAKKSPTIHAAYKLMRDVREIPISKWLSVDELSAVFKVLPNTMLPMPRLFDAYKAIRTINREMLAGDIVECGVWNGGCVGLMGLANRHVAGPKRKIHLFDSFQGLPQPSLFDVEVVESYELQRTELALAANDRDNLIPIGACVGQSSAQVERFLTERLGINREDLVFHVGWFQDTVPKAAKLVDQIALLRLDGDWYESTKICLEGFYQKVVPNGFVVIDDYGTFSGCRKAVDEFLERIKTRVQFSKSDSECVYFRKP